MRCQKPGSNFLRPRAGGLTLIRSSWCRGPNFPTLRLESRALRFVRIAPSGDRPPSASKSGWIHTKTFLGMVTRTLNDPKRCPIVATQQPRIRDWIETHPAMSCE